jgi:hypothetical protein
MTLHPLPRLSFQGGLLSPQEFRVPYGALNFTKEQTMFWGVALGPLRAQSNCTTAPHPFISR